MASIIVKLVSTATKEVRIIDKKTGEEKVSQKKTGFFYVTKKNSKKTEKLELMKYDPVVMKYVLFKEDKKLK